MKRPKRSKKTAANPQLCVHTANLSQCNQGQRDSQQGQQRHGPGGGIKREDQVSVLRQLTWLPLHVDVLHRVDKVGELPPVVGAVQEPSRGQVSLALQDLKRRREKYMREVLYVHRGNGVS